MKRMKRSLAFLLIMVLLLPLTALAKQQYYTIAELREQAAQGWGKEYKVSGRTISVSVTPQLPGVDMVPLLQVVRSAANIQLPTGDANWGLDRNNFEDFLIYYRKDKSAEPAGAIKIKGKPLSAKPYQSFHHVQFSPDRLLIPGNPLPFEEICLLMEKALGHANIAPDYIDIKRPTSVQTHGYYEDGDPHSFLAPGWASFQWGVRLHGVPVMSYPSVPFKQGKNEPASLTPHILLIIRQSDLFFVGGVNVQVLQIVEEDLPLLAFGKVIEGFEKEIIAGRVRHVFEISLEYVLQPAPGVGKNLSKEPDAKFFSKPFWRLECLWGANASAADLPPETEGNGPYPDPYNNRSRVSLLMDAQTGEIVNPLSNKYDREVFKGVKTWPDVGGKP